MKLLLYCCKAKPYLADFKGDYQTYSNGKELDELFDKGFNPNDIMNILNGKIVAECDYDIEKINHYSWVDEDNEKDYTYSCKTTDGNDVLDLLKHSCLSFDELDNYLQGKNGYAIHIKNLHTFDMPLELNNFLYEDDTDGHYGVWEVERTPANYAIIATDVKDIGGVYCCRGTYGRFLALSSHELCDILNGKKTIVVRKRVSKEML